MKSGSKSFEVAKLYLNRIVDVVVDRPLGSRHPGFGFVYEVNYGYVEGVRAPDGDSLDVYYLGCDKPLKKARGTAVAIVHRFDDDDDKLVVVADGFYPDDGAISRAIFFQERYYDHEIIRG